MPFPLFYIHHTFSLIICCLRLIDNYYHVNDRNCVGITHCRERVKEQRAKKCRP
ncbi:Uncharacterised protein [Vibrio cholerae]|nr:Uncharacterised protein [Vibrio cholerae]